MWAGLVQLSAPDEALDWVTGIASTLGILNQTRFSHCLDPTHASSLAEAHNVSEFTMFGTAYIGVNLLCGDGDGDARDVQSRDTPRRLDVRFYVTNRIGTWSFSVIGMNSSFVRDEDKAKEEVGRSLRWTIDHQPGCEVHGREMGEDSLCFSSTCHLNGRSVVKYEEIEYREWSYDVVRLLK